MLLVSVTPLGRDINPPSHPTITRFHEEKHPISAVLFLDSKNQREPDRERQLSPEALGSPQKSQGRSPTNLKCWGLGKETAAIAVLLPT